MMNTEEAQQSRFGDKAASADSLEPGSVAWLDGSSPALVVAVNTVGDDDPGSGNASVEVARLDVETVHVDDLATEYVSPEEQAAAGGPGSTTVPMPAPPVVPAAPQPAADDPTRQTTPTGADVTAGTAPATPATVPSAAEAEQDRHIAELEQRLAAAEERANAAEVKASPPETRTTPPGD